MAGAVDGENRRQWQALTGGGQAAHAQSVATATATLQAPTPRPSATAVPSQIAIPPAPMSSGPSQNSGDAPPPRVVAANGFAVSDFATGFGGAGPSGLAFDSTNNLLAASPIDGVIYSFGPPGGALATARRLNAATIRGGPAGLAFDNDGRLYQALAELGSLVELDPNNGTILRTVLSGFGSPAAPAFDPVSGDLFLAQDCASRTLFRVASLETGTPLVRPYAAAPDACLSAIAFGPDGSIYAVQRGAGVVRVAGTSAPTPGAVIRVAAVPGAEGLALGSGPDPAFLPYLVVSRGNGILTRVDLTTNPPILADIVAGGRGGGEVAVGPDRCLYAGQADRILKVTNADNTCSLLPTGVAPQLSLAPAAAVPATRTTHAVGASLLHVEDAVGAAVTFSVAGANPQAGTILADATSHATFSYRGVNVGTDIVTASVIVGGRTLISNPATVTWVAGSQGQAAAAIAVVSTPAPPPTIPRNSLQLDG